MSAGKRAVLFVITGAYQIGGGIAAANRLAIRALHDVGCTVDILALNESTPTDVQETRTYSGFLNRKVPFTIAVWKAVLSGRYDLVFVDHVNLASILLPLKLVTRIPVITRLNGIEVFPPHPTFEGRLGIRASSYLTAISDFTRQQILRTYPHLEVATIDLGLDISLDQLQSNQVLPIRNIELSSIDGELRRLGDKILLIVGRMASGERYKGHDVLIEAMPLIVEHVSEAQLVIVGSGDDMARLRELALSQPVHTHSRIFMTGYVDDDCLHALYRRCALFSMPSTGEGFGLVYLEAMRWSKACLGSRHDAAATIIIDGESGVLVDKPSNAAGVAATIVSLLRDPERLDRMGRLGFRRLGEYYLYDHFRSRFIAFIESCVRQ